ncbi:Cytochrome c1-1, heme protein, mitochondrial [Vitis vinifera]|uniref:Cytochrome c1-1, heme protein, mitochondrial n=1 Tax=Vitis vinifera TaxID=29760 RepID=A0A438BTF9_VITVI|nr:Cytochrome c1-1, heme protein, mitochondrial [Vitis vinifera]
MIYCILILFTNVAAPPWMEIREGLHYNPYFPGGAIAMPKMLIDGALEYEDDGKDVVSFLTWAAEPEMEERKTDGVQMDIFTFTGTTSSCLFQAIEVVCLQVS